MNIVEVPHGIVKTDLLREQALRGAIEPMVRQAAVNVVNTAPRFAHRERLERLHRFVRDSVPYHREPVEIFQSATRTLLEGGDCDDHVILLAALAWSLRYPFIVDPVGNPFGPGHYSIRLGMPPAEEPTGDAETEWFQCETTLPAGFGEPIESIAERIKLT